MRSWRPSAESTTSDGTVTPFDLGPPGAATHALATADDPVHAAHRKILLPHLSAKRIRIIVEFADSTAPAPKDM